MVGSVFGIGPTEFLIIAVVALLLFSPRELPGILRGVAKFWASLRHTADEFRDAIMNEAEMQDLRGMLKGGADELRRVESSARQELMKARMEMQRAQNKLLKAAKASEEAKRAELKGGPDSDPSASSSTPASNVGETSAPSGAPQSPDGGRDLSVPAGGEMPSKSGPDPIIAPPGAVAAARPTDVAPSPKPSDTSDQGAA